MQKIFQDTHLMLKIYKVKKKQKTVLSERSKIWLAKKVTWNNSSEYVLNAFVAYYIAIFAFPPENTLAQLC